MKHPSRDRKCCRRGFSRAFLGETDGGDHGIGSGEAESDVHARGEGVELERNEAPVVIHADYGVEFPCDGAIETVSGESGPAKSTSNPPTRMISAVESKPATSRRLLNTMYRDAGTEGDGLVRSWSCEEF